MKNKDQFKKNRSVVITGASGGIGRAMALSFAQRGFSIGLIARRKEVLEELSILLKERGAASVFFEGCDVVQSEQFRESLTRLEQNLGRIDYFIANAGIGGSASPRKDSFGVIQDCLKINLIAAIDGIEWVKERMIQRGSGTLVGVSSIAGIRGLPDASGYSASKAGLSTYLESLRVCVKPYGVRVITVAPGFIDTALTQRNSGNMPFLMDVEKAGEVFVKKIISGKKWIVAPWPYYFVGWVLKVMPRSIYEGIIGGLFMRARGTKKASNS